MKNFNLKKKSVVLRWDKRQLQVSLHNSDEVFCIYLLKSKSHYLLNNNENRGSRLKVVRTFYTAFTNMQQHVIRDLLSLRHLESMDIYMGER